MTLNYFIKNKITYISFELVKNIINLLQKHGVVPRQGLNFKYAFRCAQIGSDMM